jgi:hypothetical protein
MVIDESVRRIGMSQRDGIKRTTKIRKDEKLQLETAEAALAESQKLVNACQNEISALAKFRDDVQQILCNYLSWFEKGRFWDITDMFDFLASFNVVPGFEDALRRVAAHIREVESAIIKPNPLLFNFPEYAASGRKIRYDDEFFSAVVKKLGKSRRGMTVLRGALEQFAADLDNKKPRKPKSKIPFLVPEAYDVYAFNVSDRGVVYYLIARSKDRPPVIVKFFQ